MRADQSGQRGESEMAKYNRFSAASYIGSDTERYAYTLDVNPWPSKHELRDAILYRGAIVAAWGYIETTLNELAIRSSYMDEYCEIRENYPFRSDTRIRYLRQVLDSDGPFAEFRTMGNLFLDRFEQAAELRHLMAHGKMRCLREVDFVHYNSIKGEPLTQRRKRYSVEQLRDMARKATRQSRLMQIGYEAIIQAGFLPPLRGIND